jgi:hypothetical protein
LDELKPVQCIELDVYRSMSFCHLFGIPEHISCCSFHPIENDYDFDEMPSRSSSAQSDFMTLRDENLRLSENLRRVEAERDIFMLLHVVRPSKAISKALKPYQRETMALELEVTISTLEYVTFLKHERSVLTWIISRLQKARKKIVDRKPGFLRTLDLLQDSPALLEARMRTIQHNETGSDDERDSRHGMSPELGSSQTPRRQDNILEPVINIQVPDDDVTVEIEGRTYTQKGLVAWFQTTDMRGSSRRIFKAKNVEINQIRRVQSHRRRSHSGWGWAARGHQPQRGFANTPGVWHTFIDHLVLTSSLLLHTSPSSTDWDKTLFILTKLPCYPQTCTIWITSRNKVQHNIHLTATMATKFNQ